MRCRPGFRENSTRNYLLGAALTFALDKDGASSDEIASGVVSREQETRSSVTRQKIRQVTSFFMATANLCVDCSNLVDLPVAIEPHAHLRIFSGNISELGHTQYYECRTCGARLFREQMPSNQDMRWRLLG